MDRAQFRPRLHASLERIALLDLRLTCRTGLHIGAGKSSDLAGSDQPVIRDAAGRPLVPGSSLRGILRSGIEAFCRSLALDAVADPGPATDGLPGPVAEILPHWRDLSLVERLFGAPAEAPRPTRAPAAPAAPSSPAPSALSSPTPAVTSRFAPAARSFSYASRLQIADAACERPVAVELRDGVGIDRDSRTASTSIKFDLEVVPAGTRFLGAIRFKNPADFEIGLLAQALSMLDSGALLLGGKSARGLGWVSVEVTRPRFIDAHSILAGSAQPAADRTFGAVDDHLGEFLVSLRQLAESAAAARQRAR